MPSRHRLATIAIAASMLFSGSPLPVLAQAGGAPRASEAVSLNFVNADISEVARAIAVMTDRNVVVDPRVKGSVNLVTDRPVSSIAAYNLFLGALRLQGYTVVEASGLYKVVPEADAKLQGGPVSVGTAGEPTKAPGNQILTQIFKLNYETANNLVPVLRPLISPNNTINVNPGNNSLVITDYADNLQRIARIVAAMDLPNASDVEILPLKHAIASDMAALVLRLTEGGGTAAAAGQGQADTSFKTTILAEPRSNALIVRAANPARVALIRSLVERLDQPGTQNPGGNVYVVYLKNADATKLAATLRAAISTSATGATALPTAASGLTGAGTPPGAAAGTAASQPSTGGQIQADPATNSLIITAPEPQYRQLRAVIDKLDARRAQVFVESLIAEVNADKAAEFGIQWQGPLGQKGDGTVGLLGTNFGTAGANIISLATQGAKGTVTPSPGLNVGVASRTGGVYVLGFLARFLETKGDGNILSTPNLLTLDNEEAKIVVGQNVPFVTGQYTNNNASGGTVNPFQTIERKDVGLTLRVKPQISENGTIKLTIFQEISTVQASSINSATGLITNKRSIESTVLVDDGSIVVLGGLLQDQFSAERDQVPVLGNVPLFGNLFKSETRSRSKTNLMVFLRPVVVRDSPASDNLSNDRYDQMRAVQQEQQPVKREMLPIDSAPVLPQRPAPQSAGPAAPTAR
jgi:general secretion pathway protein D